MTALPSKSSVEYRIWWSTGKRSLVKDSEVGDTIGEHARVGVSVVAMDKRTVTDWEPTMQEGHS